MAEDVKPDQVAAEVAPMNVESDTWEGAGSFQPRASNTRPAFKLTVNLIETYKHINKVFATALYFLSSCSECS